MRLKYPVIHQRQIYFNKEKSYWVVKDILKGTGKHTISLYFHFAPIRVEFNKDDPSMVVCTGDNEAILTVKPLNSSGLSSELIKGWISSGYGDRLEAFILKYSKIVECPAEFTTIISKGKEIREKEVLDDYNKIQTIDNMA
jgi:hypothetical protein